VLVKCLEQKCTTPQINQSGIGFKPQALIQRILCLIRGDCVYVGSSVCGLKPSPLSKVKCWDVKKNARRCMWFGAHFSCRS
jgi:hypothetical protein